LQGIWDRGRITNGGPLVLELQDKLLEYLAVPHLQFVANGTIALQLAIKSLDLRGEIITTPYSYVATSSCILWENCVPVFVDIESSSFNIDPVRIEERITERTCAILATHVYGYPCNVGAIESLARKFNLRVIYDAAHAFGSMLNGKSLLGFGDVSTCSFHGTKLFHTGEGGCVVTSDKVLAHRIFLHSHFGHIGDSHFMIGINGKNSELHAAMGLAIFSHVSEILETRRRQWLRYKELLSRVKVETQEIASNVDYNYAYFPVLFQSEEQLLAAMTELKELGILARRYFYPSLNTLPYVNYHACPIADDKSRRVACLPLFHDLKEVDQQLVVETITRSLCTI
jgi:dTDP-4-amino-4,6-dideoxygalactose transaminase